MFYEGVLSIDRDFEKTNCYAKSCALQLGAAGRQTLHHIEHGPKHLLRCSEVAHIPFNGGFRLAEEGSEIIVEWTGEIVD